MLANQGMLIEAMRASHRNTEAVLELLSKTCGRMNIADVGTECDAVQQQLKDTESLFTDLSNASTADLSQVLDDVKKFATDRISLEGRELQEASKKQIEAASDSLGDRFKTLESRVLSELASGGDEPGTPGRSRGARAGDGQTMKKVTARLTDFEAQVQSQLSVMTQDMEKKLAFLSSQPRPADGQRPQAGVDSLSHDIDALKYDLGELKDIVSTTKSDHAHVKRVVLACERDMEDFTAAMDAVNVDLDEMRARVDSTHSIVTSRQRVEATVTAEISTMRLDMGDMQEALKAHDAWMEDVSQSLQEAHERCHNLSQDISELRDQTQAKLDGKTDIQAWNEMNDDMDASIKTVRDMASALRLDFDSRRRQVDDVCQNIRANIASLDEKIEHEADEIRRMHDSHSKETSQGFQERMQHCAALDDEAEQQRQRHRDMETKHDEAEALLNAKIDRLEQALRKQDEDLHRECNDRMDGVERHHANVAKETTKRLNALDLRISGLQGSTGEQKRDINKLRDEVNNLTVKSAAHDVDVSKNADDIRRIDRSRNEDNQRHKQDMDAVYEELDQKVYEKSFQGLESNVTKLTRGTVKLCQVVGVFPGARAGDGSEEELDIDVELLNWEDCAQNLTARVEKTWRQLSSQKFRSVLDLVSKKADHSVLRLLQISQQHIESQLDRVRHERELWKEVVDKRAQQPLQLALSLKDPHTGAPLGQGPLGMGQSFMQGSPSPLPMDASMGGPQPPMMQSDAPGGQMKPSPLAKRMVRPQQGPPPKA